MDDLEKLKVLTDENDAQATENEDGCCACAAAVSSPRMFTDDQLKKLLELHDGDVRETAYDVLIRKAENSGIRLAGGTELPDQREYWMSRARAVRPNKTKPAGRADDWRTRQ